MKKVFLFFCANMLFFLFAACGSHGTPDGGPCEYNEEVYGARVAEVIDADSTWKDILLVVEGIHAKDLSNRSDTILYSVHFGRYISTAEIEQLGLRQGNEYRFIVGRITSGTCNPHYEMLQLVPYQENK
jgi:hypothetical protein